MKAEIFLQKTSNLFAQNRLLKFTITILALTVMFNSAMVYRAVKYQRVVLIPPTMTGTVEFIQGKPNDAYIRDISRRIVNLVPLTRPRQHGTSLKSCSPILLRRLIRRLPIPGIPWPVELKNHRLVLFSISKKSVSLMGL